MLSEISRVEYRKKLFSLRIVRLCFLLNFTVCPKMISIVTSFADEGRIGSDVKHVFTSERMASSLLMHSVIRCVVIDMSEAIDWRIRDVGASNYEYHVQKVIDKTTSKSLSLSGLQQLTQLKDHHTFVPAYSTAGPSARLRVGLPHVGYLDFARVTNVLHYITLHVVDGCRRSCTVLEECRSHFS